CASPIPPLPLGRGPFARFGRPLFPLLYNRRHFGVMTFLVASLHVWFMLDWYITLGALPSLAEELTRWPDYARFIGFPFKTLGIVAFMVLFLMAATSHDFWLVMLTPKAWKALHMAVYGAYGLVVMHVALGIMQTDRTPLIPLMLFGGFGAVAALHLVAGFRERDRGTAVRDGWIVVGPPRAIPAHAPLTPPPPPAPPLPPLRHP